MQRSKATEMILRRINRGLFSCLLLLGLETAVAFAQLPTATILGTVKDSSGAVIPQAAVSVRNVETGMTRTDRSGADGSYRFVALPVGSYEVRAEQAGFRTEVRSGVTLAVGQEAVVHFALQVGAIEQTVEVTGEAPLVNTTSGALGGLVGEQQVSDLPLNGRNYVNLTLLQPGVVQHRQNTISALGAGTWFSANGAPPRSNFYMLDGAPIVNAWGGTTSSATSTTLGIEGIREWRVVTNSFSAEYGMRMGSQMTIVSKGGTNSFHGSLFEYLRNSALDARNFFDYKTAVVAWRLPPYRRNQYGASAGGPLRTDKAFFFATYEGLKERLGLTNVLNVIPPADKVDGGRVPQIHSLIKPLLALYPDPNLSGNRYAFPTTQTSDENYGQVRGDYIFSTNDMVFARYTIDDAAGADPLEYPGIKRLRDSRMHFVTASNTHTFSPILLGTFRFSFSRSWLKVDSRSGISGPQYSFVPGQEIGVINIGGVTKLGPDLQTPNGHRQNVYSWSGDLFYTKGRHSLKFGSLINRYAPMFVQGGSTTYGNLTFTDLTTFLSARPSEVSAITPGSIRGRTYGFNTLGFYLHDDLRVKSNLTFNLGLRYEFQTDITEVNGHGSSLRDVQRDAAFTGGLPFANPSLRNISPRFGFAWDVRGDGKTALRGGFGLLYDIGNWGSPLLITSVASPPLSTASTVRNPASFSIPLTFPPEAAGKSVRTMDYHIQQPHMLHYNLTVERQLPFDMAVSLAYGGSRGLNLIQSPAGNPTFPQIFPDGRPFWTGREPRRNPNWDDITFITGAGNSWYNSLQFVLTKRLSQGLQFQSAYTWAKVIDEKTGHSGDDSGGSPQTIRDPLHRKTQKGLADFNAAHTWRLNAIYRLPERSALGAFWGKMLNGWWMSGILTTQTGLPFTATLASNRSRSQLGASGVDHPDLNVGRKNDNIILGGPDRYFDPLAFSIPAAGFLGTAGRNILSGPGVANLDFSLVKDTALGFLGESGKLEFRAEFFNLLNRANFFRPNALVYAARVDGEAPLAAAGRISRTDTTSRQIQLALKVLW